MARITCRTEEETARLGRTMGERLVPGDCILLSGEMGAGKSVFARGMARGLGIDGAVPSPTFTIMNLYEEGRIPFCHFDLYRIADSEELYGAGLLEYLPPQGGACAVEWPEILEDDVPGDALHLRFEPAEDGGRTVYAEPVGRFDETFLNRWFAEAMECAS